MTRRALSLFGVPAAALLLAAQTQFPIAPQSRLFNGWGLSPAGEPIPLAADMPARMLFSRDARYLFVNTAGFNEHGITVIDLASNHVLQHFDLAKSWIGLVLNRQGDQLISSGGGAMPDEPKEWGVRSGYTTADRKQFKDPVYLLDWRQNKLSFSRGISLPPTPGSQPFTGGLAAGPNDSLYVVDAQNDSVFKLAGPDFHVVASGAVGYRPNDVAVSPSNGAVAVSNCGDASVSILDPGILHETARIPVGSLPTQLIFSRDGRLFVANSASNSVSVIAANKVVETINVAIQPNAPIGSTPTALAVNPAGTILFVANAGNNDVAMVDISVPGHSSVMGFIPTGWYPTALAVAPDNTSLFIGVGKGLGIGPNVPFVEQPPRLGRPPENLLDNPRVDSKQYNYLGTMLRGYVYKLNIPDSAQLAALTARVRANQPEPGRVSREIEQRVFPNIKHVVYIIRENRTYDQVFGDVPRGDGDPNLVLFGNKITPNAHRLADQFVLFDRFYANGEVSVDGHDWCDLAYATDFTQWFWMYNYSGRGDFKQDGRLRRPGATLWELAGRHGLDYRNYGEGRGRPNDPLPGLDTTPLARRDTTRVDAFLRTLKDAEQSGKWPALMVLSMPTDHTQGLLPDAYSPEAMVADNDLAIGRLVETVSKSRFWKETAIFAVEDDAQDGPDHVEAHRTVALAASPWIKRGLVDHTAYTQVSLVRTIELIFHLPALSQFDEDATPLGNIFTTSPDLSPYSNVTPNVDREARNRKDGPGAVASLQLDFSDVDRANPGKLNEILWNARRPGQRMPPSVHSPALFIAGDDDDR